MLFLNRIWINWFLGVGFLFIAGSLKAQQLTGTIKNDKAYVMVTANGQQSVEELAGSWGISVQDILAGNPGLSSGSQIPATGVLLPIGGIIKGTACDSCMPVYHRAGKSEGLYRIGKCYGNKSVATLKKMNNLRGDALQLNQELLVGYLAPAPGVAILPEPGPATVLPGPTVEGPADTVLGVSGTPPVELVPKPQLTYTGNGVFEPEFESGATQITRKQGKAGAFKSESGWTDGRFYILISQLKNGVVVKVSNPVTGNTIYAKVVGPLPKIKQNEKLDWRLSSAAMVALGSIGEDETMEFALEY